jgi:hypothetical protein
MQNNPRKNGWAHQARLVCLDPTIKLRFRPGLQISQLLSRFLNSRTQLFFFWVRVLGSHYERPCLFGFLDPTINTLSFRVCRSHNPFPPVLEFKDPACFCLGPWIPLPTPFYFGSANLTTRLPLVLNSKNLAHLCSGPWIPLPTPLPFGFTDLTTRPSGSWIQRPGPFLFRFLNPTTNTLAFRVGRSVPSGS